jgi:amphi-Trp domain-containing protein
MQRHVFDMSERATHTLVADQLRSLADQFNRGAVELAYEEDHAPTVIHDPVDVVVDLTQGRHQVELVVRMSWSRAT